MCLCGTPKVKCSFPRCERPAVVGRRYPKCDQHKAFRAIRTSDGGVTWDSRVLELPERIAL